MRNSQDLGRLQRVDVREIWVSEAQDFTPWLAMPENLEVLSNTLALELELEAQEKNVGPFRADLLCKDTLDGSWVLIENQLEKTDHTHLGQLLTYAAGLHAVTVVWISTRFTDEHRASLDWLNEITGDEIRFFGLEVELWRIGDSPAAPKFNIISKPNEWTKSVGEATKKINLEEISETKALQLKYWTQLRETLLERNSIVRPQKPHPQHWYSFSIGRTGFNLSGLINTRDDRIGIDLNIMGSDAKIYFNLLLADRETIEREIQTELIWLELPERTSCRVVSYLQPCDPLDESRWPEYQEWMIRTLEQFDSTFRQRIKALDVSDYTSVDEHE